MSLPGGMERLRLDMVRRQIAGRGIANPDLLRTMEELPRHLFVPPAMRVHAYEDHPLPIGAGQTISQPYMVALMTEALCLRREDRVLEIGTGSGYQAAVLGRLVSSVVSVERLPRLAEGARENLRAAGIGNVKVVEGDGSLGWVEDAPYDRILVTAGAPRLSPELCRQLKPDGILVAPVGSRGIQDLLRVRWDGAELRTETLTACVFVPLVGIHGWKEGE